MSSDAVIDGTWVSATQARADARFGDGIAVFALGVPATATVLNSLIEGSARAAVANFGALPR